MEQDLFRILYCSRNLTDVTPGLQGLALGQIFETARHNNARRKVTGALLHSSGYFAQVLEGPVTEIEQVFEKIQRDPRHGDVTVIECAGISSRDFPEWSMARVEPVTEAQSEVAGLTLQNAISSPGTTGSQVLELMRNLVIQEN